MQPPRLFLLLCWFAFIRAASAVPVISEFMASNKHTLLDEDGDSSDWIEIHNPDAVAVNMSGWSITDTQSVPREWIFPAQIIPAKGYLVIFASGKNRSVAGQELHTNFDLKASGEYLALIEPDGVTKTTEYAPFPPQFTDVSYGTCSTTQSATFCQQGSPATAFVPTSNALGTTWQAIGFNDSAWLSGTLAAGYFNFGTASIPDLTSEIGINLRTQMGGKQLSAYIRVPFTIADPSKVEQLTLMMNYDDGFAAFINGQFATSGNAPAAGTLAYNSLALSDHSPGTFETFDVSSQIGNLVAGTNILAIQGLNNTATSSDLFQLPQLVGLVDSGATPIVGYFPVPTPGAPNGGPSTIELPQTITYSRAPGPFTSPFNLAITGAASGQQIRYLINAGGGGAALADPTITSTLYSAPILISASTLIRAAVFDPVTGEKGATLTAQYPLLQTGASNNTSNFTSTLPIMVIDDQGGGEPVDDTSTTPTTALFTIFNTVNGTATLNSVPSVFCRAGVSIHGSSSAGFPKKSFDVKLWDEAGNNLNLPLLGLASDHSWDTIGPWYYDRTFIHNVFIYQVSRNIGRWASQTRCVETFTNTNGGDLDYTDYTGVSVLLEKIQSSSGRLNITSIQPSDNSGDAVTGGYIFKIDRAGPGDLTWTTANGVGLVLSEPNSDAITPAQTAYLEGYVQSFDTTIVNEANAHFATRNYRNYIDVGSWVDHHILNSLAFNVDGLRLSSYFFKDRDGKINAGPLWDFDRALGSYDGRDANAQTWNNINYYFTQTWWGQLFQDPDFVQAWVDRWQQLRLGPLSDASLNALADQLGAEIGNTVGARDAAEYPDDDPSGGVYLNEIANMKSWLTSLTSPTGGRTHYIDNQLPAAPTASVATGIVSAGTQVTLTGTGPIRYTTNGTDPRPSGGSATSTAATYSGPITINQTTVLTARRTGTYTVFPGSGITINSTWSGVSHTVYLVNETFAEAGDIGVSEINYNPLGPTPAESAAVPGVAAADFEFIELRNIGNRQVNTLGMQFVSGKPFAPLTLGPLSLPPGAYALVVRNKAAFAARYGTAVSKQIVGEWVTGSLSNSGEEVQILARDNSVVQDFTYSDGAKWPADADGNGSTLEYIGLNYSNADYNNPLNWRSSSEVSGSPGVAGAGPDQRIVINELLSNSTIPFVDAIELYNNSALPVDVSGWYIADTKGPETIADFELFRIPNGTVLPAGGYQVYTEVNFNPNGAWNPKAGTPGPTEFAFDGHNGGQAWLVQTNASGLPIKFIDHWTFGAAAANESFGRWPNGAGNFYPMKTRTLFNESSNNVPLPGLGAFNSVPRVGPVIIDEIHHTPASGNANLQFIELRNTGAVAQSLANWQLGGDVSFNFAATDTLAPGAVLVLVPFAPSDTTLAPAFRAAYRISSSVVLEGPWSKGDSLGVSGHLVLYAADTPPANDPGFFPLITEDETHYASASPWPNATGGPSLNRLGNTGVGDDPTAWKIDVPSPGTYGPTYAQWAAYYFPGGGAGTAATDDFDGDGASNGLEYSRGTNPRVYDNQLALNPALTVQQGANASYVFSFTKPVDRPGAQYQVQQSSDLMNWVDVADTLVSTTKNVETHQAIIPIGSGTTPPLFFRLEMIISQ